MTYFDLSFLVLSLEVMRFVPCSLQDPISLEVVAQLSSAERWSYARMSMTATTNSDGEDEDAIVLLGDEVTSAASNNNIVSVWYLCEIERLPIPVAPQQPGSVCGSCVDEAVQEIRRRQLPRHRPRHLQPHRVLHRQHLSHRPARPQLHSFRDGPRHSGRLSRRNW